MIDLYQACLTLAKIAAKPHGYAVALHGSGFRDLDLLVVPWTDEAGEPAKVLLDIIGKFQWELGGDRVSVHPGDMSVLQAKAAGEVVESSWGSSMVKPHGRAAITVDIGSYVVDLSIMPRKRTDTVYDCRCPDGTTGTREMRQYCDSCGLLQDSD
jgi:hypothetical protein